LKEEKKQQLMGGMDGCRGGGGRLSLVVLVSEIPYLVREVRKVSEFYLSVVLATLRTMSNILSYDCSCRRTDALESYVWWWVK